MDHETKKNRLVFSKTKVLIMLPILLIIIGSAVYLSLKAQNDNTWKKANDYYKRADYVNAAKEFKNVSLPTTAERLGVYGQTMFAVKEFDKSTKAYEELYKKTKDPFAKLMLGNIANTKKDYDTAIKSYQDLINANPNYIAAYSNLAMVYRLKGDVNQAIATAKQGVTNNPKSTEMRVLMVSILATQEDAKKSSEYKDAVDNLRKLDPKNALLIQLEQTTQ